MSLRDEILESSDLDRERIEVFDTREPVYLRELSGKAGDYLDSELILEYDEDGQPTEVAPNMRAKLLVHCIVDEDGNRVFTEEDADALGERVSSATLQDLFSRLLEISGATEEYGGVEELAGNSASGASASSATVSR